jgi:hypothetical protein
LSPNLFGSETGERFQGQFLHGERRPAP